MRLREGWREMNTGQAERGIDKASRQRDAGVQNLSHTPLLYPPTFPNTHTHTHTELWMV